MDHRKKEINEALDILYGRVPEELKFKKLEFESPHQSLFINKNAIMNEFIPNEIFVSAEELKKLQPKEGEVWCSVPYRTDNNSL